MAFSVVDKNDPMYKRHPDPVLDIVFVQCQCYIWPISIEDGFGKCKLCGVKPFLLVSEPLSGKAEPINY